MLVVIILRRATRVHDGIEPCLGAHRNTRLRCSPSKQQHVYIACTSVVASYLSDTSTGKGVAHRTQPVYVQQLLALEPTYTSVLSHGGPFEGKDSLAEQCKSKLRDSGLVQLNAP